MLLPLLMFGALIVMFVFMGRKQKKQDKEIADMRNGLRVGDEVTTNGGIIGRIVQVKEETVVLETSRDGTKIRFLKSAIARVDVPVSAPAKEEPKGETLKDDSKPKKK
ncbi:MAG: preprotein translocase subunit YajC [Clostridia bacterium]|nr:preprotein translocase subunit YajC [Clostridia bacterium]